MNMESKLIWTLMDVEQVYGNGGRRFWIYVGKSWWVDCMVLLMFYPLATCFPYWIQNIVFPELGLIYIRFDREGRLIISLTKEKFYHF
jgi:hypothetical protein